MGTLIGIVVEMVRAWWEPPGRRAWARFWAGVVVAVLVAPIVWVLYTAPLGGGGSEGTLGWSLGQLAAALVFLAAVALARSGWSRRRTATKRRAQVVLER